MEVLNLFSGCGGCSLGLKQANFFVNLAVDIDKDACNTYTANLGVGSVWCSDISNIKPDKILAHAHLRAGEVDLIVGGPPCQGFSSAGTKDWTDPRNTLIRNFVEIITSLKPTWFIMENVEGLLTTNNGFFLIEAVAQFLNAGYWVRVKKVYMEEHGLPQRRKRVIIVGNLEQCNFDFPPSTHSTQSVLPTFEEVQQLTIVDAIGDLPFNTETNKVFYNRASQCEYQRRLRREDDKPVLHHQTKILNEAALQRIHHLGQGETMKHLPPELQHPSFTKRAYRRVMDGTPTEKRGGAPSGLKRLIAYEPSLTITSSSSSEFIHPTANRPLTLRECARIQSFPDWYEFSGSWNSVATQIGNAIPPVFMELLARHIQKVASWQRAVDTRGRWLGINATKSDGMSPALVKMLTALNESTRAYAYTLR